MSNKEQSKCSLIASQCVLWSASQWSERNKCDWSLQDLSTDDKREKGVYYWIWETL